MSAQSKSTPVSTDGEKHAEATSEPVPETEPATTPKRRYGGISSADRDELRRARLIEAGIAGFGDDGYPAATIESICRAASVSTRDFYRYHSSKEDLLLAVYDHIIESSTRSVADAIASTVLRSPDDTAHAIHAGIKAFAESMARDERWARINFIEIVGVSHRVELHRRAAIHRFAELIRVFIEALASSGRIEPVVVTPVLWVATVGAVHETLTDWVIREERPPLESVVDDLASLFGLMMLRGPS